MNEMKPDIAWRTIDVPNRGVVMLHQRAGDAEVETSSGGYGSTGWKRFCSPSIVRGAISIGDDLSTSTDLAMNGLFVDIAVDPTGKLAALANPGSIDGAASVMLFTTDEMSAAATPALPFCQEHNTPVPLDSQVTAVTFISPTLLAVQSREPAAVSFYDVATQTISARLDLQQPSRRDTGHTIFHMTTDAGIACASCHAEAGDDGHVWTFEGIGPRRTQNVRGGILGSEPFHWNGDMQNFASLINAVFHGRMSGPQTTSEQSDALAHWIDRQPSLRATPADSAAVARGKVSFESAEQGCTQCHDGARLTNNMSADVGTGAVLQVPSLHGLSFRAPFMHDGCAATLADRFGPCGGGDKHGHTSPLDAEQLRDLITYLESL